MVGRSVIRSVSLQLLLAAMAAGPGKVKASVITSLTRQDM